MDLARKIGDTEPRKMRVLREVREPFRSVVWSWPLTSCTPVYTM